MEDMQNQYVRPLAAGTVLHGPTYDYTIIRVLGQGTFGITYQASIKVAGPLGHVDVNVALKEFFMRDLNGREGDMVTCSPRGQQIFDDYKRKFIKEARALGDLEHPNIVNVIESFEANGTAYYAMEYLADGSLDDLIVRSGKLPEERVAAMAREIAAALDYMHSHLLLHLDLKPGNIMLRDGEHPVLIDFGLAKKFDGNGQPETNTTVGNGTPGYAPLEQQHYHDEMTGDFPATMDIYALGGTMFKMLTGERPPDAGLILNEGFPAYKLEGVGRQMITAVEHAMAARRLERPRTIADFLALLPETSAAEADAEVVCAEPEPEPVKSPRTHKKQSKETEETQIIGAAAAPEEREPQPDKKKSRLWLIGLIAAALAAVAVCCFIFLTPKQEEPGERIGNSNDIMKALQDSMAKKRAEIATQLQQQERAAD